MAVNVKMSQGSALREHIFSRLFNFYQNGYLCDFTLHGSDCEVKTHSLILSAASPHFQDVLSSHILEGRQDMEIDMTRLEIEILLQYIYTGTISSSQEKQLKKCEKHTFKFLQFVKNLDNNFYCNLHRLLCSESEPDNVNIVFDLGNASNKSFESIERIQNTSVSNSSLQTNATTLENPHHTLSSKDSEFSCDDGVENADAHRSCSIDKSYSSAENKHKEPNLDIVHEAFIAAMEMRDIKTPCKEQYSSQKMYETPEKLSNHCYENDSCSNNEDRYANKTSDSNNVADLVNNKKEVPNMLPISSRADHSLIVGRSDAPENDGQDYEDTRKANELVGKEHFQTKYGLRSSSKGVTCTSKYMRTSGIDSVFDYQNSLVNSSKGCVESPKKTMKQASSLDGEVKSTKKGRFSWYKCPECKYEFKSLKLVAGHRYSKHGVAFNPSQFEVLKCRSCNFETLEAHRFETHQLTAHSSSRPYVCEWCGKSYKMLGALTLHANTHTKARKYPCPACNKSFSQQGTRKRHIRDVHSEQQRPHLCDVCPFSGTDKVKLFQHKYLKHSTPLPPGYIIHKCPEDGCEFETFRREVFTGHINSHKGVQEYACKTCQKTFSKAGNLRSHMRTHKDKSFHCTYPGCNFATKIQYRLTQHSHFQHTHKDVKPHQCEYCSYKTAIKGNLRKHQKNVHKAALTFQGHKKDNSRQHNSSCKTPSTEEVQAALKSGNVLKSLLVTTGSTFQLIEVTEEHVAETQQLVVAGSCQDHVNTETADDLVTVDSQNLVTNQSLDGLFQVN